MQNESLPLCAAELASQLGGDDESDFERREINLCDRLVELVSKLFMAMKSPEHFYISCSARANGSLSHAAGDDNEEESNGKVPKKCARPPTVVTECKHPVCVNSESGRVIHCTLCDGSSPRWESVIAIQLLTPSVLLAPIANKCRSLVFASGSLSPLGSLCAELGLVPAPDEAHATRPPTVSPEPVITAESFSPTDIRPKLQVKPPPLESNHVIDIEKQLRAISIGTFPDGSTLTTTYSNYKKEGFYGRLGDAIAKVVESIPRGGVLVFFPSYSFLRNFTNSCKQRNGFGFNSGNLGGDSWDRFVASKGTVVVEPTGNQADFEAARERFMSGIRRDGRALLLAVFRGKMSEGISFNDDFARAVICVGIPFPNKNDRAIQAKISYNSEMRNLLGKTDHLPGMEWYSQQAYRAIAQALGRCIRHSGDYGAVILMDSRHCDDGSPVEGICRAHQSLPKWMRSAVRNLSMSSPRPVLNNSNPPIFNGYAGLSEELKRFFEIASEHSKRVLENSERQFKRAQADAKEVSAHSFDHKNGTWSQ